MARVYARVSPGSSRAGKGASRPRLGLGSFISVGRSLDIALDRVVLAERLGYEAVFVTQIADRDSLTTLIADAARTERIRPGTRMMPTVDHEPASTRGRRRPLHASRVAGGIAAPGSLGSRRDSLPSPGSSDQA
jgi:alkanesulfonate monooxygenase SsuD/methylene tetrahydromethanopterin reductase-like flavin-dependent oxidoreductase (luciferase family)